MIPFTSARKSKNVRLGGDAYRLNYTPADLVELHSKYGVDWKAINSTARIEIDKNGQFSPEAIHFLSLFIWIGSRRDHARPLDEIEKLLVAELRVRPLVLLEINKAVEGALKRCKADFDKTFGRFN